MLVSKCKRNPKRLGLLAECLTGCDFQGIGGEWPGHYLSTRTVAYSCGILARDGDPVTHAHDPDELERCRRLSAEAAKIVKGVYINWADESDHLLEAFAIPVNDGDKAPARITEKLFRAMLRGTLYPEARITIEPFRNTSPFWEQVTFTDPSLPDDPDSLARVAKWNRLLAWFRDRPELHAPAYIGIEESQTGAFAAVYPKWFVALTEAGSLVGLVTCVVWT